METSIDKPLVIDENKHIIRVWNTDNQTYTALTFELIEDLYSMIQAKKYQGWIKMWKLQEEHNSHE